MKKKVLSLLLAVVMTFSLAVTANAAEETAQDLDGDIVILHTNDVHGAISGYAKVAALKDAYEAEPERWNNCPDMMDCDPWTPPAPEPEEEAEARNA